MSQTWLYRAGLCALILLPVAHLTSLGVMEMAGFLLLLASLGLFLAEYLTDAPTALSRVRSRVALPILGYSMMTIMSAWVMLESTEDQLSALRELKWVLYLVAFTYFLERFANPSWCWVIRPFLMIISVLGFFALIQFFSGWELPRTERVVDPVGNFFRVTGFFNVPQSFAGNIGMAVFFVVGFISCSYARIWKENRVVVVSALLSMLLGSVAVLLTLTRSAWLAGTAVFLFAVSRVNLTWSLITAIFIACCLGLIVQSNSIFAARLLSDTGHHQASIEQRIEIWRANWQMFQDYPFLGVGPGKNVERLSEYFDTAAEHRRITSSHNNVLEVATTRGDIRGVILLLVGCILPVNLMATGKQQ